MTAEGVRPETANPREHRPAEGPGGRSFAGRWRVVDVDEPTLVLGSTQPPVVADVPVVRRRSGGGAVFVRPGAVVWVDVFVPAGDVRWEADVGRAFWWLGDAWAAAIGDGAEVHRGRLVRTRWSDRVCFAGLGAGEVTVGGRKVVGMSQRRTREGALFQCAALLEWDYEETARLLDVPALELRDVAAGVGGDGAALLASFLDHVG